MNDAAKIYQLYAENATAQSEQPTMMVDKHGNKSWRLHGKLHRENAPAIERADGNKYWYLHGKLHREDGAAIECVNGDKYWYLHGKLHRENAPAIERADGNKSWWLHGKWYDDVNAWAKAVLKMRNEPCDDAAAEDYLRTIFTKDDLI